MLIKQSVIKASATNQRYTILLIFSEYYYS